MYDDTRWFLSIGNGYQDKSTGTCTISIHGEFDIRFNNMDEARAGVDRIEKLVKTYLNEVKK